MSTPWEIADQAQRMLREAEQARQQASSLLTEAQRHRAAEARNGMPETVPYSWRACWDGSRRARRAADILADMEARAQQGSGGG